MDGLSTPRADASKGLDKIRLQGTDGPTSAHPSTSLSPPQPTTAPRGALAELQQEVLMTIGWNLAEPEDLHSFLASCRPCWLLSKDPQFVSGWLVLHRRQQALVKCCAAGHSKAAMRLLNTCESPLKRTPSRRATPGRTVTPCWDVPDSSGAASTSFSPAPAPGRMLPLHSSFGGSHGVVHDPSLDPLFVTAADADQALCAAAEQGHTEVVSQLLGWGIPADGVERTGKAVIAAAKAGQLSCVSALVEGQRTPVASAGNSCRTTNKPSSTSKPAKRVLFNQAEATELNASDLRGQTEAKDKAIYAAAGAGQLDMLKFMKHSKRFNITQVAAHALVDAAAGGHVNVMRWLWDWEPDQPPGSSSRAQELRPASAALPPPAPIPGLEGLLFSRLTPLEETDSSEPISDVEQMRAHLRVSSEAALSRAAERGHAAAVELLLSWGTTADPLDVDDVPPIQSAAAGGYLDVVQLLATAGADINVNDSSPLRVACLHGYTSVARYLLELGAEMPPEPAVLLCSAARTGNLELVRLLLGAGVDPHASDEGALRCAASAGAVEVVRELLSPPWNADVHANEDEALLWAVDNGQEAVVRLLLAHGAAATGLGGEDMLWQAVMLQHRGIIAALMDAGARLAPADDGSTLAQQQHVVAQHA